MLSHRQLDEFRKRGHLTVGNVFSESEIAAALRDLTAWGRETLQALPDEQREWYLEKEDRGQPALRKLDHPVYHRPVFRALARHRELVAMVQQLLGPRLTVFFSQVFMKPPEVGGPKPIHQDNYYFGPDDPDATLTVWIALDDATTENGCLHYADEGAIDLLPHQAPPAEPYNLQIAPAELARLTMSPAPVPRGGISFHHGNTPHQSSANRSAHPRRAVALHYIRGDSQLATPALPFDPSFRVKIC